MRFPFALLLCAAALAGEVVRIQPDGIVQFEFPELGKTLRGLSKGEAQAPALTATYPSDYSAEGRFPLFVYILGGDGGHGEKVDLGRGIIGPRGYICVTMPLFKQKWDPAGPARGLMILKDDYTALSEGYRKMLEKLYAVVPNIDRGRSVFGGHSNGAHATGVLLAGRDGYLLENFRDFYLHEGGAHLLNAEAVEALAKGKKRLLLMFGDKPFGGNPPRQNPMLGLGAKMEKEAAALGLDFTFVTMKGYGHEQPMEYMTRIGAWARGEAVGR